MESQIKTSIPSQQQGGEELLRWLADGDLGLRVKTPILMKSLFLGERSGKKIFVILKALRKAASYS